VLQILLLLEQATYGCTSAEIQARYALYILAATGGSSSATACVFTMQHLSDHQRYSMSDGKEGGNQKSKSLEINKNKRWKYSGKKQVHITLCRLREERAAERRKQEAHAAWRQLLRSIWTRLRLHQDYGDNAAAHAGQQHADHALLGVSREDLSGKTPSVCFCCDSQFPYNARSYWFANAEVTTL